MGDSGFDLSEMPLINLKINTYCENTHRISLGKNDGVLNKLSPVLNSDSVLR
jgi:hypothetical protein